MTNELGEHSDEADSSTAIGIPPAEIGAGEEESAALLPAPPNSVAGGRVSLELESSVRQLDSGSEEAKSQLRLQLGVLLLLLVAVIWVGASALVQYIFSDLHLQRPFFLTYLCNSEFVLLLPLRYGWQWCFPRGVAIKGSTYLRVQNVDWRPVAKAAAVVCPLWFLAQGSYNWSLAGTSVSSSTILSSTSCVFTLLLSRVLLKERSGWMKACGVLLTIAGATLTGLDSEGVGGSESTSTWWGDALAVFSAFMYGVYTTAIKKLVPEGQPQAGTTPSTEAKRGQHDGASQRVDHAVEDITPSSPSITLFFGFLGLFNTLALWPVVIGLHFGGVEDLAPITGVFIGLTIIKGLVDNVLSDVLWAKAIHLTSPTLATVALSLTIPIAMLSDFIIHGTVPSLLLAAGSGLVVVGFLVTTVTLGSDTSSPVPDVVHGAQPSAPT